MATHSDGYDSLLAEYTAATAQERAEWKVLSDSDLPTVERIASYARWRAAAERIRVLSVRMRDSGVPTPSLDAGAPSRE